MISGNGIRNPENWRENTGDVKQTQKWKDGESHCDEYVTFGLEKSGIKPNYWLDPKTHSVAFGENSHWATYERLGLIQSVPSPGNNVMLMKDGVIPTGKTKPLNPHMVISYKHTNGTISISHYTSSSIHTSYRWTQDELQKDGRRNPMNPLKWDDRFGYGTFGYIPMK